MQVMYRVQFKYDDIRWRTGREVKGKLANGVGSQYPSHYHGTWCIQHYYRITPPSPDLNRLVRFAERRNLVYARVPSYFNWPLQTFWRSPAELSPNTTAYGPQIFSHMRIAVYLKPIWIRTRVHRLRTVVKPCPYGEEANKRPINL